MEFKRKANGQAADVDDRSQKRRKVADIDLSKGETPETTTAYGLAFLEQIRRTADKSGRLVATYFEKLIPREGNAEYYKRTRLPISLETTEAKLNNGKFQNLAALESDFKRMISNAKEFYPRSSQVFEDAERVRKALSNFMTKTNPAYNTRGYQAVPTPLPPEDEEENEEDGEGEEGDEEGGGEAEAEKEVEEDADGVVQEEEKEEEVEEEGKNDNEEEKAEEVVEEDLEAEAEAEAEAENGDNVDEDAEGEEENVQDATAEEGDENDAEGEEGDIEEEGEEAEEGDEGGEEEEEEEEEEEAEPRSRRKSIILKRRKPGRPPKNVPSKPSRSLRLSKPIPPPGRPDHEYEDVPYKGLTFQQAQEKIVEELLRHREPEYDDAYFEPFVNLPPRSLRDYFKVITDPISLKKLQKMVKGIQGRHDATGVSEFKSWSAFEEKSKLLWENAYFYNEEGSEIYSLAQDLEKQFYIQLNKAQAVVAEPAQPKIKLKVGQAADTPGSSKKITIHVGGRGGSRESPAPAPQKALSTEPTNGANTSANGITRPILRSSSNQDMARGVSMAAASPIAGVKAEESVHTSSPMTLAANTPGGTPAAQTPAAAVQASIPMVTPQPVPNDALANGFVEQRRFRAPGKGIDDALISNVRIQIQPNIQGDRPTVLTVLPNAKEMQQSATINLPPNQHRVLIIATLPPFLRDRQYSLWMLINKQPLKQCLVPVPGQQIEERTFDVALHQGLNVVEAHLIAAIPRSEREPGGPEVELEIFTIFVNVTRTFM